MGAQHNLPSLENVVMDSLANILDERRTLGSILGRCLLDSTPCVFVEAVQLVQHLPDQLQLVGEMTTS